MKPVYKFDCGCEFEILDDNIKECDGLPSIKIDYENIRLDCDATWRLLQSGKTKGVFQLETQLGQTWAKKLAPSSLEEMSALISLIRPGCLKAFVDGKSMTQLYVDRKHHREEIQYFHKALEPILKPTYGVLVYQEQSMQIATNIAGFNLQEADILRKAIGKKKPEIMTKAKNDLINGCENTGIVDVETANNIADWIQQSQRYAFNKSHGMGYGLTGYWSAYAKAHFPLHFFCAWLAFAKEKIDPEEEVESLISDAKTFDIQVYPPSMKSIFIGDKGDFSIDKDHINFGMYNIKQIGNVYVERFLNKAEEVTALIKKAPHNWNWYEFLVFFSNEVGATVINNVISVGLMDHTKLSRRQMVFEYNIWKELTAKEKQWIKNNFYDINNIKNIIDILKSLLKYNDKIISKRKERIIELLDVANHPPYSLDDTPHLINKSEKELLGIALSSHRLDSIDSSGDTSCKEFLSGKRGKMSLAVEIKRIREHIIKSGEAKGKKMAFLTVEDQTSAIDQVVAFSDVWEKHSNLLYNNNTVLIIGERSNKRDADSFIIKEVYQI